MSALCLGGVDSEHAQRTSTSAEFFIDEDVLPAYSNSEAEGTNHVRVPKELLRGYWA